MRKKVSLKKMADADVHFVSLVGRAANRIPFRVIKSDKENGMLDLGKIGRVLKGDKTEPKAPAAPEIVAVVVEKSDLISQITDALKDAGLDVSKQVENEDNTISYVQKEDQEDLTLLRMDDNVVLVLKGFSSYANGLDSFNEIVKAQGFYQGLDVACSAFRETVSKSLYDSNNAADVVKKVDETVNSFGAYVRSLAAGLPAKAFYVAQKVDSVYKTEQERVEKAEKEKAEAEKNKQTVEKSEDVDLTIVPDDISKKDWEALDDAGKLAHVKKSAAPVEPPVVPQVDVADLVKKAAEAVSAALMPKLDAMASQITTVSEANTALNAKVDSVVQKSDDVARKVGLTVVNATVASDNPSQHETVKKKDEDPRVGAFDTAMIRKHDRYTR